MFSCRSLLSTLLLAGAVAVAQDPPGSGGAATAVAAPPPPSVSAPSAQPVMELTPDENGSVPQEQIRQLLRLVADKDLENERRLRDYTYIERSEQHRLDGPGAGKQEGAR